MKKMRGGRWKEKEDEKRRCKKKIEVKTLYLEPKQPNSLQKKMLEMAGQDLDQFMKVQDEQDNCSSFFFIPLRWGAWGGKIEGENLQK